ncbi:MAG TPA: hypothetical protein V6D18_10285 [Thermosynechococcaceae cyanobacterium]
MSGLQFDSEERMHLWILFTELLSRCWVVAEHPEVCKVETRPHTTADQCVRAGGTGGLPAASRHDGNRCHTGADWPKSHLLNLYVPRTGPE